MMLRVFVFWCYRLVVAGCLRVTISDCKSASRSPIEKLRLPNDVYRQAIKRAGNDFLIIKSYPSTRANVRPNRNVFMAIAGSDLDFHTLLELLHPIAFALKEFDNAPLADQMSGADDHEIAPVRVEVSLDC